MTYWPARQVALLQKRQIEYVIDVGANDGGFAKELFANGYKGKVLSFEPLIDAWCLLQKRTMKFGERWQLGPRVAIGCDTGEATFNEAGNSASSSLLPMLEEHERAAPQSAFVNTHTIQVNTLDNLADTLGFPLEPNSIFLKIDVQGAEHMVLEGATSLLEKRVGGVQLEMSLEPLYDGQKTSAELDETLRNAGFKAWDMIPGFRNPNSLQLLQYDGIYLRS